MNLYEIDQAILDLVDLETGEILDYEAFSELKMAKEEKIEGMALWCKNLDAEAKAASLKEYLTELLSGSKFSTARVACTFRKSKSVKFDNDDEKAFIQAMQESQHFEYLKFSPPEVNRTEITNAIKAGQTVPGAQLIEKNNLSIK